MGDVGDVSDLQPLRDAFLREAWPEALDLALEAWRACRDSALVPVLTHASDRALTSFAAPQARTRDAFDQAWREVAARDGSAVATGWLAANLTTRVPEREPGDGDFQRREFARERHAALLRRVELLGSRGADPRVARAAFAVVAPGRLGAWDEAQTRDLYRPLLELLTLAGDPSLVSELEDLERRPRSRRATVRAVLDSELRPTIARLERVACTDHGGLTDVRGLLPGHDPADGPRSADIDDLVEQVRACPESDDLRTVLGDAWLEAGGPRAELVRMERQGVEPDDHRVRRVIRRHAVALLGEPLAAVLVRPILRNGVLHTATVRATQAASPEAWEAAAQAPELGTLRVLRKGHASGVRYSSLVLSPLARDLRGVDVDGPRMLEVLARGPRRRLQSLRFTCVDWDACLHLLANPSLATVTGIDVPFLHPPFVEEFERCGLSGRIEELGIASGSAYLGYRGHPAVQELGWLVARFPRLRRFVAAYDGDHAMVAFEREGSGWALELRLPKNPDRYYFVDHGSLCWLDPERNALWTPPRSVRRVRLTGYVPAEVQDALARSWRLPVGS